LVADSTTLPIASGSTGDSSSKSATESSLTLTAFLTPDDSTVVIASQSSSLDGALIGGIVGSLFALSLIAALVAAIIVVRRRRRRRREFPNDSPMLQQPTATPSPPSSSYGHISAVPVQRSPYDGVLQCTARNDNHYSVLSPTEMFGDRDGEN
jgi:hypothetical protein